MTFSASSNRPKAAVHSVARSAATKPHEGGTTKSTVITMAMSMMTPPMVGVPCFTKWLCGPSARTCWPICVRVSRRIQAGMSAMVKAVATMKPRNTRNDGYAENSELSIIR